jgi:hypothetical protein
MGGSRVRDVKEVDGSAFQRAGVWPELALHNCGGNSEIIRRVSPVTQGSTHFYINDF